MKVSDEAVSYETKQKAFNFLGKPTTNLQSLVGSGKFTIQARLSGGKMWQHSQIFRQGKHAEDYPFELNVQFM